jgi:hypothetical protein
MPSALKVVQPALGSTFDSLSVTAAAADDDDAAVSVPAVSSACTSACVSVHVL